MVNHIKKNRTLWIFSGIAYWRRYDDPRWANVPFYSNPESLVYAYSFEDAARIIRTYFGSGTRNRIVERTIRKYWKKLDRAPPGTIRGIEIDLNNGGFEMVFDGRRVKDYGRVGKTTMF